MKLMKRGWLDYSIAFLALALHHSASAQDTAATRSAHGIIEGLVVGEGRFPAAGVLVTRQVSGQAPERTATDARGRFRFEVPLLEDGLIMIGAIRAFAGNLAAEVPFDVHRVSIDGLIDVGRIALLPTGQLRVRAVDRGLPLPGVRVSIGREPGSLVAEAVTDDKGLVAFEGLVYVGDESKPWFNLSALSPDGKVGSASVVVGKTSDQIATLELVPPRRFALTILDALSTDGIAGARSQVSGTEQTASWRGPWVSIKHSDRTGRILLEAPPVGERVPVWIRAAGYEEWTGELAASGPTAVEILLRRRPAESWK